MEDEVHTMSVTKTFKNNNHNSVISNSSINMKFSSKTKGNFGFFYPVR